MILLWLLLAGVVWYAIHKGLVRKPMRHEAIGGALLLAAGVLASRGATVPALAAAGLAIALWSAAEVAVKRSLAEEARALRTLGLEPGASEEDIRAAHRKLSATAHPDRGGSTERQQALNAARDLLLRRAKAAMR